MADKGEYFMKMVYAIVHSEDGDSVTEALMSNGYIVTKLATTGGFLRRGNKGVRKEGADSL